MCKGLYHLDKHAAVSFPGHCAPQEHAGCVRRGNFSAVKQTVPWSGLTFTPQRLKSSASTDVGAISIGTFRNLHFLCIYMFQLHGYCYMLKQPSTEACPALITSAWLQGQRMQQACQAAWTPICPPTAESALASASLPPGPPPTMQLSLPR